MVPPPARDAAHLAARRASQIFRAVTRGPQPPAPAGWGVEPEKFRGALPWFRWRELVVFANHFAQHGSVANDLAVDLADEVGRRLNPSTAEEVNADSHGTSSSSRGGHSVHANAASSIAFPGSSQEVAAVVYSFSKLTPQMPEYAPVFAAVAKGIAQREWKFSRLEAGLIGTALVDVQLHVSNALPGVVRPILQDLHRTSEEENAGVYDQAVTIDELRYLVHACTCLPSPGIKVEEVEVLAAYTQRLIGSANFAKAAHLVVSWLQIRAPAKAKRHHLDALGAVCARISGERATHPAHPLLIARLGPALARLLAREAHRDPPAITPPLVREVVIALMQISRGMLTQADIRPPKGDALNFVDWVNIIQLVVAFCDEHGHETDPDTSRTLPGWAAEALGYVVLRAHRPLARRSPPDLDSLLTILQLLRRYKAKPAPDSAFFIWVAKQLAVHHQSADDSMVLAEIVGELVPQLPPAERVRFAKRLFQKPVEHMSTSTQSDSTIVSEEPSSTRRLLQDPGTVVPTPGVTRVTPVSVSKGPSVARSSRKPSVSLNAMEMRTRSGDAQDRLWGKLGDVPAESNVETTGHSRTDSNEVAAPLTTMQSTHPDETAAPAEEVDQMMDKNREPAEDIPITSRAHYQPPIQDLHAQLQAALKRVEALETKLEEQSAGLRDEVENLRSRTVAAEVKVDAMPKNPPPLSEASAMPQLPSWPPAFFLPEETDRPVQPRTDLSNHGMSSSSRATLQLRKPFDFEQFRRAESQGLQNTRLRVLVPPDPMQPFPRK